jgi:hypothetical protein
MWVAMSPWSKVTEELSASVFRVLIPKNALCFDHLNPENGGSKLSGNVCNIVPMDVASHGAALLTTVSLGR